MQEIAGRLKLPERWLYEDPWHVLEVALQGSFKGKSFHDLMKGEVLELRLRERNEYQTPSGKIEFSSSRATEIGARSIPFQAELNTEQDVCQMLNSSILQYTHSQFTDVYGPIPQLVWINEADAQVKGIGEGDTVALHNKLGRVLVRAVVNEKVKRWILWAPRLLIGLDGSPLNVLAPGTSQEVGGGPNFSHIKVRMQKG